MSDPTPIPGLVSVVAPVYNNAATLSALVERVRAALSDRDWEIILVNDGSADASLTTIRELCRADHRVKGLSLSRNFGQHPATAAGLERARGSAVVIMDADLQDRPEDIPTLLARLADRRHPVEIVYSLKTARHEPPLVRLTSKLFHFAYGKMTRLNVPPNVGTFRAFSRKVLVELMRYGERGVLYGPLMFYMGFPHDFVEVEHMERAAGKSSYNFARRGALALGAVVSYTDLPHRLLLGLGGATITASLLYALFNIVQYLIWGRILQGGLTVIILLLLFSSGAVFLALGLIGIYIFRIFQEVLHRPRYHLAEALNLDD